MSSASASLSARCSECEADIALDAQTVVNEILECSQCGLELEVVTLDPPTLQEAPEVEEDWGE